MTENTSQSNQVSPQASSPADFIGLFLRGIAMGAADVVPGVSGGTIAFITGIYARFINALRSLSPAFVATLLRGRIKESLTSLRLMHWSVLIPVGLGVGVSIVGLSKIITGLMTDKPGATYSFFFGLILASAWIPLARMKARSAAHFFTMAIMAVLAWLVVGLQPDGTEFQVARHSPKATTVFYAGKLRQPADVITMKAVRDREAKDLSITVFDPKGVLKTKAGLQVASMINGQVFSDKKALNDWLKTGPALVVLEETRAPLWWIFCCGLIAISAMVLPGLSGSFLLLFLGQYHAVFSSLHQCIGHVLGWLGKDPKPLTALTQHDWTTDFVFCGLFGLGVLLGLAAFSRVVSWLFERTHDVTMAALTGLMIGALRLPGEVVLADVQAAQTTWGVAIFIAAVGGILVTVLGIIDQKRSRAADA